MAIYYIHSSYYDYCNEWTADFLHCKNKKFLEDLCLKLNKQCSKEYSFDVRELNVLDTPTKEQVRNILQYHCINYKE